MQVEVSLATPLQCPITLETPPIVPVVTGCGHIFSLPAIVHCMLHDDGEKLQAATCPLCHHSIIPRDLRLVSTRTISLPPDPSKHEQVTFTLIRRPRDSILPVPVLGESASAPVDTHEGGDGAPSLLSSAAPLLAISSAPKGGLMAAQEASKEAAVSKEYYESPLAQERDKFAKFVTCNNALPAMRAAAAALAHYAAIIVAAGGMEAEIEGPSLFKSMDILAERARAWTLRRHETLAAGTCTVVGASARDDAADMAAVAAASEAEHVVRDVFRVCMADERSQSPFPTTSVVPSESKDTDGDPSATKASILEVSHRDALFPALPGARAPVVQCSSDAATRSHSAASPVLQERRRGMWGGGGGGGGGVHSDESDHHDHGSPLAAGNSHRDHDHESQLADYADDEQDEVGGLQFDFDEAPQTTLGTAIRGRAGGLQQHRVSDAGLTRGSGVSTSATASAAVATGGGAFTRSSQGGGVASDSEGCSGGLSGVMSVVLGPPLGHMSPVIGSLDESIQLLGSSPHAGVSVNQMSGGDYFMYQVADGSWLFLHPINVRFSICTRISRDVVVYIIPANYPTYVTCFIKQQQDAHYCK